LSPEKWPSASYCGNDGPRAEKLATPGPWLAFGQVSGKKESGVMREAVS
jgi:hypothetical protein